MKNIGFAQFVQRIQQIPWLHLSFSSLCFLLIQNYDAVIGPQGSNSKDTRAIARVEKIYIKQRRSGNSK